MIDEKNIKKQKNSYVIKKKLVLYVENLKMKLN